MSNRPWFTGVRWNRGLWLSRCAAAVIVSGSVLLAEDSPAEDAVPAELMEAFGWKPMPRENYQPYRTGSVFAVGSEPAKWPAALDRATAWVASAPAFEKNPADYLLRKLARIEALALGAADAKNAAELRTERKALGEHAAQLRAIKSENGAEWQMRNIADRLQELNTKLGEWLADSPADRVEIFREELATCRPKDRAEIVARFGGEERFAELVKLAREYHQLQAAYNAAQQALADTTLPEPERKQAFKKAAGALGYFYGYNQNEVDFQRAMRDADFKAEIGGDAGETDYRSVRVPDLVTWIGEAEAEKLLIEAYALPVKIELDAGTRTGELGQRLLLAGKLKPARTPWSLLNWRGLLVDVEAAKELAALFDAAKKQFPDLTENKTKDSEWNRRNALAAIAYALAATGRMDEGVSLITQVGPDGPGLPYDARATEQVAQAAWDLILRAFGDAQNVKSWTKLKDLAGPANRSAELTVFAAKQAAAAAPGTESAKVWQTRHGWALLGDEKIDEGLALLSHTMDSRPGAEEKQWTSEWTESATRLFLLAKALLRPELATTWAGKLAEDFKKPTGYVWKDSGLFDAFASHHMAAGNFALIEEVLRARVTVRPTSRGGGMHRLRDEQEDPVDLRAATLQLADVLGRQGRHAEVVALLAESPDWGEKDLADMIGSSPEAPWRSLPLVAAESLQAVGRGGEAVAILEAELVENGGHDPSYALYTRIQGTKATPFLEKLWARDRYEERPLIWMASLQLGAGQVAKAEATVKQAIATDPSDGEQPKGDRMRAYAVLREVALKQGDGKQAEFLARVVGAIRRSENADDLASAGLVSRAIKEYQLALDMFSDAYCIQSRLARKLAEENRADEAAEHYRRAFELMPESFGRVESHCFGCERAFSGKKAQSIAEKVFLALAAKPDAKPQVYYLLGYLRMEQERWEEAAGYFTQAVMRDPDYLNAWKKLAGVLPNTQRPRSEQDRVAFKLLALDPSGKHGSDASEVRDLRALWQAYAAAENTGLVVPATLFRLGDKAKKAKSPDDEDGLSERSKPRTTAERLAKHEVLENITRTLDALYAWKAASVVSE